MEELWYPLEEKEVRTPKKKVYASQVDFLSSPKHGKIKGSFENQRRFQVGCTYHTAKGEAEVVKWNDTTAHVVFKETGQEVFEYPVRAIFSKVKEKKPMNQVVVAQAQTNEPVTMTSLELVDFINELRRQQGETVVLQHKHFLAKVEVVLAGSSAKFLAYDEITVGKGAVRKSKIYRLPKREATLMAMSYSHEISAQVYDKMEALEKQVQGQQQFQVPTSFRDALALALAQQDQIEQQQQAIAQQQQALAVAKPKVEFVDRFVDREGTFNATSIGKKLNVSAQTINKWLVKKGAMFKDRKHLSQWYLAKGYGVEKFVESNGNTYQHVLHTPTGAEWILSNFNIQDV